MAQSAHSAQSAQAVQAAEAAGVTGWGRWQARLAALLALPVLLTGLYGTNYVFLAAQIDHRCEVPECEDSNSSYGAAGGAEWGRWALPERASCSRWAPLPPPAERPGEHPGEHPGERPGERCAEHAFNRSHAIPCDRILYKSHGSIVAEFGLGCQESKRALVGTVHNIGMLISLPIMGHVSDKYGRRAALVASGCGAGLLGLAKSFAGSYYAYIALELLETVLGASVYPAAFVLMIEWLGVEHRILASLVLGIPLSAGAASLALLDYLTGYWRLWARIAYPPSFLLLLYPWVLPESIRWLANRGRVAEAVEIMKRAARWNRIAATDEALERMLGAGDEKPPVKPEAQPDEESLCRAFMKYGALRRRLCICMAWWLSAVFVFYGLAVRAAALAGAAHGNYALLAAAELPALLANTLLLDRAGRRATLTAACLLTAAALVAMPCLPEGGGTAGTALYLVGKLGATMTLNALYVYTAELFPTRARHRLLAACSTAGRVGAVLAPLTSLLAEYKPWLPTALFGALPLLSAALTRLVPDTLRAALPDSFADLAPRRVLPTTPSGHGAV